MFVRLLVIISLISTISVGSAIGETVLPVETTDKQNRLQTQPAFCLRNIRISADQKG